MKDIPFEEAAAIIDVPMTCEAADEWFHVKLQPGTREMSVGVIHPHGKHVKLEVQLLHRSNSRTGLTYYKFTLYQLFHYGKSRVYQLDVLQSKLPIKDAHSRPHEHIGASKLQGKPSWANWEYDEVLAYFCERAKILFVPPPAHPESFELRRY